MLAWKMGGEMFYFYFYHLLLLHNDVDLRVRHFLPDQWREFPLWKAI